MVTIFLAPYRSPSGPSGPTVPKKAGNKKVPGTERPRGQERLKRGEAFSLTVGAALLKVELLPTLQSPKKRGKKVPGTERPPGQERLKKGEAFLLTVGAFLLAVELLCLQSLKALIRRTFPL